MSLHSAFSAIAGAMEAAVLKRGAAQKKLPNVM
jgi:hypothetical protein